MRLRILNAKAFETEENGNNPIRQKIEEGMIDGKVEVYRVRLYS